jgi:hypothetical protein
MSIKSAPAASLASKTPAAKQIAQPKKTAGHDTGCFFMHGFSTQKAKSETKVSIPVRLLAAFQSAGRINTQSG